MSRKFSLAALLAALLLLSGCFLFEETHDFAIEESLEIITPNRTFETPLVKVRDIKCIDFAVDQQYEKVSDNWYKITINKKIELNGKDISKDYLKLLDLEHETQIERFFTEIVKNEENLFKSDEVYVNPNDLNIYADASGTKTVEESLKDANFDRADWAQIFSKILDCYQFNKIPKIVCQKMDVNDLHKYIIENRIKDMGCMGKLAKDSNMQSQINQWNLYNEYKDEKKKMEFKKRVLAPFKNNCFKDASCGEDEACSAFSCKKLMCDEGYESGNHECIYSPFENDPEKAKYVYMFVPVDERKSDEEWENDVLSRADFMADIYPIRECKDKISMIAVPISWVNKRCKIDNVAVMGGICPSIFHIATCGKEYAKSIGINKVERVIGFSDSACNGSVQGYAFFHFDGVYAQKKVRNERLEQPAHEVAHTYKICDEYNYGFWNIQNREINCPNKFPEDCDEDSDCYGNKAEIVYSGHFEAPGNKCKDKELYSIMGSTSSDRTCGLDKDAYNALEKQISCS